MSVPTLILDTNVIVSALRSSLGASHRLVRLLDQGAFEVGLTAPLVFEYEAVCKRLAGATPVTAEDVDRFVDYLCHVGKRSVIRFRVRPDLADRTTRWCWKQPSRPAATGSSPTTSGTWPPVRPVTQWKY